MKYWKEDSKGMLGGVEGGLIRCDFLLWNCMFWLQKYGTIKHAYCKHKWHSPPSPQNKTK